MTQLNLRPLELYVARWALMLLVVLPATLLIIALIHSDPAGGSLWNQFATLVIFFLFLGPVLATAVFAAHSLLEQVLRANTLLKSAVLAALLGGLAVLPLVLSRERLSGVIFGIVGGSLYGILTALPPLRSRSEA